MKIMCLLIALAFLTACETLHIRASRTLSDGTVIATDGRTLSVTSGKDTIALDLPRK